MTLQGGALLPQTHLLRKRDLANVGVDPCVSL